MDTVKVASLDDFKTRFENGRLVQLPVSRLVVRLRGISFEYMIRAGKLPDPLLPLVAKQLSSLLDPGTKIETPPLKEQVTNYIDFIHDVVAEAVIEPKGLNPDWIDREDREYIVGILHIPLDRLADASFLESKKSMEPVRDEPEVEYATVPTPRNSPVGAGELRP